MIKMDIEYFDKFLCSRNSLELHYLMLDKVTHSVVIVWFLDFLNQICGLTPTAYWVDKTSKIILSNANPTNLHEPHDYKNRVGNAHSQNQLRELHLYTYTHKGLTTEYFERP